jgi:class 3 adenylate cyclase/DNA-binding winged helix-turn-helix (wHTH) protein
VEFRTLGPLEVVAGGQALALGGAQQRAVLALLLLRAPEAVSLDRLTDELWGERPPATAQHALQVHVSGIRKVLGAGGGGVAVRSSGSGYVLEVDAERVDARRFERLVGEAQHALVGDPSHARDVFVEALELWRGPPLVEFGRFEFARLEADRLEELHAVALEGLVESRLSCGEHREVIAAITALVAAHPLRERPRRLLMLALYRSGRHAEALGAYRDACAALDEIGLQPGPELRHLEEAILRHDASLGAPPATAGAAAEVLAAKGRSSEGSTASSLPGVAPVEGLADGEALPSVPPRQTRKVVTALFCDVTGSTALGEELDPEALHAVMNRYFAELRATIERHGGTVDKFIGDAVMAVFGIPRVREDDALRAVRAAAEIRERLPAVAEQAGVALSFRTAVNTGLVLVGEGENLAIGDAVNVAARLEQAAAPGEILLGDETLRLVRDAVEVESLEPLVLKGKSAPVRAFRLVRIDPLAPGLARHFDRPLVGRERELALLRAGWDRTVQESGCHLFTLLGVAGVGKSRLVSELLASIGDAATALSGRCLHYGEGITFWPLLEALTPVGEAAGGVLEHLGGGGAATPEELFWEVRRLLESLATQRPAVLHVDDLQWAEPMLLDLLDHVVELSRGAPILVLCTARPELLEHRPAWAGGKLNATTVLLEPLAAGECEALLDHLGDGLPADARGRVVAASEGNPLFLEEMAALTRERGTIAVPPTIQALLAARLECLPLEEREVLERGAIEGEVFHRTTVRALANLKPAAELGRRLAGLVRKELIRPHTPAFQNDEAFRFRHMLIRDAAYDGLPKATRAELHERFARWLEENASELAELDEIAGWHLEQTVLYQRELGRKVNLGLARRAAEHLHAAGRRAGERSDLAAARNLLERAHALAANPLRARIGVDLAEQLIEGGSLARVDALLSPAERDPATAAQAALTRFELLIRAQPEDVTGTLEAALPDILAQLAQAGDERGLARAHLLAYWVHMEAARATPGAEQALLAAEHARHAGDEGLRSRALGLYLGTLVFGRYDVATLTKKVDAIESEDSGPYVAAFLALVRGELERLQGHFGTARRLTQNAIEQFRAVGHPTSAAATQHYLAWLELSAGQPARALPGLLEADISLAEVGERGFRSTVQAILAEVYESLGNRDDARAAIELSDELGGEDDVLNVVTTHAVRARLALADGDLDAAERWARSAVEHAFSTDNTFLQGNARFALAGVLSTLQRRDEASSNARAALELFQVKGDRPRADRARELLDKLAADA